MAKFDPGRLIQETRELVAESKALHDRSRNAVTESSRLQKRLALPHPKRLSRERRKRLLEK